MADQLFLLRDRVLELPHLDAPRLDYAKSLSKAGRTAFGLAIEPQLIHPLTTQTVDGRTAGFRHALSVTSRRGFIDEVVIPRNDVGMLRIRFREHPLRVVHVAEDDGVISIGPDVKPSPGSSPADATALRAAVLHAGSSDCF